MVDTASFAKLVPGFDFLQGLVKNAGAAIPSMGQWVAPTLDPDQLEKRIDELKTVQFWLEQNAKLLGATIQALEVQRMTLSTLKTMNVQFNDLRDSLTIKPPAESGKAAKAAPPPPAFAPKPASAPEPAAAAPAPKRRSAAKAKDSAKADKAGDAPSLFASIDPMQAWAALTQQFTQIAANAMKDTAGDAAKNLAGSMVKQGFDVAKQAMTDPVKAAAKVATAAAGAAGQAGKAARAAAGATAKAVDATAAKPARKKPAKGG
jgi:hypothetical protein